LAESGQKTLKVCIHIMGFGSVEQGGAVAPLDFHRCYW